MAAIYESDIEQYTVQLLKEQGYVYHPAVDLERETTADVVLRPRLHAAIDKLNPKLPEDAKKQAMREVLSLPHTDALAHNELFHTLLCDGVAVEYQHNGEGKGARVQLIDFAQPQHNDLVVSKQITIRGPTTTVRVDVVLWVNGLPLVVMELKNPAAEQANLHQAFRQLKNYQEMIPALFGYNGVLIIADGLDAKVGSITTEWQRFMTWKTIDGRTETPNTQPQHETLIKGMLCPTVLLDLVRHFTVLEKTKETHHGQMRMTTHKKIAAYHQYYAVHKAVESTLRASGTVASSQNLPLRDRKAGVVWHTQGSGKSLSMVFYAGQIIALMNNPTLVIITDRNELDDQLFNTFVTAKHLLRQDPKQANTRAQLRQYLTTAGGGVVFTTIQKFFPDEAREHFAQLSPRENIVVMVDEAHRSHYGFAAKTTIKNGAVNTRYGFAKYLRDALPYASFIGFTGTPIDKEHASTKAVFGDYIDIYDIAQSVADGATVPIYYQPRLAKVHLADTDKEKIDAEVDAIISGEEFLASEKAKAKWARVEAIVGHPARLRMVAANIIDHFEKRQEAAVGKGMIATMSRRVAVALYAELVKLRPAWHQRALRVIMTASSSDPPTWQPHHTTPQQRKELGDKFKSPEDPLQLVIVCDMWLTGFDVPCLHTMYVDKPLRGHNLVQAIARVNRIYKDKPGGLVVDYIGIAAELKQAVMTYSNSGGRGQPTFDHSAALVPLHENYEVVVQMLHGCDYQRYFAASTCDKLTIILATQEHILSLDDGQNRFIKHVQALAKAFALATPHQDALALRDDLGFFQAVKARLQKFAPAAEGRDGVEIDTAIRQMVDGALAGDEVIDIFAAAGMSKPNIAILSDEFLQELRGMAQKNVALALLKKLLQDEIRTRGKKNMTQGKRFSEMLTKAINQYQNKLLTAAQVIDELIVIAKSIRDEDARGQAMDLSEDEIAFYDALADNDSASEVLGDDTLRNLARVLVAKVRANTSLDWTIRKNVQANLRRLVKRILREYGYPPDEEKLATDNILKQAELLAHDGLAA